MTVTLLTDYLYAKPIGMHTQHLDLHDLPNEFFTQGTPRTHWHVMYVVAIYHGISTHSLESVFTLNSSILSSGISHSDPGPPS